MAVPATRDQFKDFCLRRLGEPVIQINVEDDQVEDRIDEALLYYQEYHYDATETYYFKYQIQDRNFPDAVYQVKIANGGTNYANNEALVFTANGGAGSGAAATIGTDSNGTITSITFTNHGSSYPLPPTVSVTTVSGTGASLEAELGGFIELPDSIIGVVDLFDLSSLMVPDNMFSVEYQIALNDLWSLSSYSMIPYYTTIMQFNLIAQLLVGKQPLRYQRHKNRLYVDMSWRRLASGNWIVGTAYQAINPNEFPDVWKDRWLINYTTALIKRQWGSHLKKFGNQQLPGGMVFNGQQIYNEAEQEIQKLQDTMISSYSLPVTPLVG